MSPSLPIILVFGPSGVGKSSLGERLAQQFNFHHREIDRYPEDGIDLEALRPEWDAFLRCCEARPLSQVVSGRASACGFAGAVLTFPGNFVPLAQHLSAAESVGMTPVVLFGQRAECLAAFLGREGSNGRGLGEIDWHANNDDSHAAFGADYFEPYRLWPFERGSFRDGRAITREVRERAG